MKKIDWAKKLSSRKLWVAVVGFVSTLCVGLGVTEHIISQIISIIMAAGCLVAYILAEGWVDVESVAWKNAVEKTEQEVNADE